MIDNLVDLERRAALLTLDERAQFALHLLESLEPVETGDIEAVWRTEAESRLAQVEHSDTVLLPAEQVFGNLKQRLS
jgi:hypothetical protein